jgi:hypothetical protein
MIKERERRDCCREGGEGVGEGWQGNRLEGHERRFFQNDVSGALGLIKHDTSRQ